MLRGTLLFLLACAARGAETGDVTPKPASFHFHTKDQATLVYGPYAGSSGGEAVEDPHMHSHQGMAPHGGGRGPDSVMAEDRGLPERDTVGRDGYPYVEEGEIKAPKPYLAGSKYSKADLDRIKRGLIIARRYADVNNAFRDGYRLEWKFDPGMGIHTFNLDYLMSDEVSIEKPEFLTYAFNRKTGRFQLLEMGYMHRGHADGKPYKLFDAPQAHGHFHAFDICARVDANVLSYKNDKDCAGKDDVKVGPVWMMHFAVNIYNENGLFADAFPYVNYLSSHCLTRSFYGAPVEP